ncbi:MAG: hypothetical protein RBT69_05830, partial [Spirochaetia bacterium]|nr:hypothetical protein [Spirochaetia bacterium]
DNLRGLKENIIIGHLIPAGTGQKIYKNIKLYDESNEDIDASIQAILEARKKEELEAATMQPKQHSLDELD